MTLGKTTIALWTAVITFFATLLICGFCNFWKEVSVTFYNLRLIELLQVMITATVAVFVAVIVSQRNSTRSKQRELDDDLLKMLLKNIEELNEMSEKYVAAPSVEQAGQIIGKFRQLSLLSSACSKICKEQNLSAMSSNNEKLKQRIINYKRNLTDSPFGEKTPIFRDKRINVIQESYQRLFVQLTICRNDLWK